MQEKTWYVYRHKVRGIHKGRPANTSSFLFFEKSYLVLKFWVNYTRSCLVLETVIFFTASRDLPIFQTVVARAGESLGISAGASLIDERRKAWMAKCTSPGRSYVKDISRRRVRESKCVIVMIMSFNELLFFPTTCILCTSASRYVHEYYHLILGWAELFCDRYKD